MAPKCDTNLLRASPRLQWNVQPADMAAAVSVRLMKMAPTSPTTQAPAGGEAPAGLHEGRAAFNRGAFFQAHELWEALWLDLAPRADGQTAGDPDTRLIVQGLIQIAAGCHHLQNDRPGPAARLLAKGADKLQSAPPTPPFFAAMPLRAFAASAQELALALNTPGALRPATLTL